MVLSLPDYPPYKWRRALLNTYAAEGLNQLLLRLMDIDAVKIDTEKGFKLKLHEKNPDAPLSPIYINLRVPDNKGTLERDTVGMVARCMHGYLRAKQIRYDGICGIPRAGEPFTQAIVQDIYESERHSVPTITLTKVESAEGRSIGPVSKVQGLPRGSRVLLVDDLITKANSKHEAIIQLRKAGFVVNDCLVFLDRLQGGGEELRVTIGVRLHSVLTIMDMLALLQDENRITADQFATIEAYLEESQK